MTLNSGESFGKKGMPAVDRVLGVQAGVQCRTNITSPSGNLNLPVSLSLGQLIFGNVDSFAMPSSLAYDPAGNVSSMNVQSVSASQISGRPFQSPQIDKRNPQSEASPLMFELLNEEGQLSGHRFPQVYGKHDQISHTQFLQQEQELNNGEPRFLPSECSLRPSLSQMEIHSQEKLNTSQQRQPSAGFIQQPLASTVAAFACETRNIKSDKHYKAQQLILLYHHALSCSQCKNMSCYVFKQKMCHIPHCNEIGCVKAHRQIKAVMDHYTRCRDPICPVCFPVRLKLKAALERRSSIMAESAAATAASRTEEHLQQPPFKRKRTGTDAQWILNGYQEGQMPSNAKTVSMEITGNLHTSSSPESAVSLGTTISDNAGHGLKIQPGETFAMPQVKARLTTSLAAHSSMMGESAAASPTVNTEEHSEPPFNCRETGTQSVNVQTLAQVVNESQGLIMYQEGKTPSNNKLNSTELTGNLFTSSSPESTVSFGAATIDNAGVAGKVQPVVQQVTAAECNQEVAWIKSDSDIMELDKPIVLLDISVAKKETRKQSRRGASSIESFTPEQIREHIRGLQGEEEKVRPESMEHISNSNSCSLCGKDKLVFEVLLRYCASCSRQIRPNGVYYYVGTKAPSSSDTPKSFCSTCFNSSGEIVKAVGEVFPKSSLCKGHNYGKDDAEDEPWVQCDRCKAWQHQICALFNGKRNKFEDVGYTCPSCLLNEIESGVRMASQQEIFVAKDLPETLLSAHVEQWLFRHLTEERQQRAHSLGKSFDEVPAAENLIVREVSSVNKAVHVRDLFYGAFQDENYPLEFPYKSKAILLFQKIEGADVCLFAMFVQEFGSECPNPNQRCIYLSYIDSVKYFRPEIRSVSGEALRTFVYHQILIGYLDYCKKRGFVSCYIWACPPLKRDDYILYCHPEIQKTPKADKLREWYSRMSRKAEKEKVVVNQTNLHERYFEPPNECRAKITAARLPYFESDFWPGEAEIILQNAGNMADNNSQKTTIERAKRAARRYAEQRSLKDILLMHELTHRIRPMKDKFIILELHHSCKYCYQPILSGKQWACDICTNFRLCDECHKFDMQRNQQDKIPVQIKHKHPLHLVQVENVPSDTNDNNETIESDVFNTRMDFLSLCQRMNYQFGSLRRAKHSTMMFLHHLQTSLCKVRKNTTEPGHDVSDTCYQREGAVHHAHESITAESDSQNIQIQGKEDLQMLVGRENVSSLLVHASRCFDHQCRQPVCCKIKRLFHHGSRCPIRATGGCKRCQYMWCILQRHARTCKEPECIVPRCRDLKIHMAKQLQPLSSKSLGSEGKSQGDAR